MPEWTLKFDNGDRQMLLLALAELSLARPGWDTALLCIVERIGGDSPAMYQELKHVNADRVQAERMPLMPLRLEKDDEAIVRWVMGVAQGNPVPAGGFLFDFVAAVVQADYENYPILRPAVVRLKAKFPKYRFDGAVHP